MKKQRRKHSAESRARVALEAMKGIKTLSEIAKEHEIHPILVDKWNPEDGMGSSLNLFLVLLQNPTSESMGHINSAPA